MSIELINECRNTRFNDLPYWKQFIKLVNLNDQGIGSISIDDLPNTLISNNGKTVTRTAENFFNIEYVKENRRTTRWNFTGFNNTIINNANIPLNIKNNLKKKPCVILHTYANVEVDHKYAYNLYHNDNFRNNENNFQSFARVVNAKKREEKKKKETTGYKFDNTNIGLKFITAKYSLKYDKKLLSTENPYDGDYWTDPKITLAEDTKLYNKYYNKFYIYFQEMPENEFESYFNEYFIPQINLLVTDEFYIQDIDLVVQEVMENLK